jgi:hypothetical protein
MAIARGVSAYQWCEDAPSFVEAKARGYSNYIKKENEKQQD